jgi:hypothetical protein
MAVMYEAYFTRRLLEALNLADDAGAAGERSLHLRASGYYRDLLKLPEKRRAVRHSSQIGAMLHHVGTRRWRVTVSDLSTDGFRIALDWPVKPGHVVVLEMDGLSPLDAYVVWQKGDQIGAKFLTPLHPALVEAALSASTSTE